MSTKEPLESADQLRDEMLWKDYAASGLFCSYCTLKVEDEKLTEGEDVPDDSKMKQKGVVYVLVVHGRILKIGQTTRTFKERLRSYNGGQTHEHGSTNYYILQSLINLNKEADGNLEVKVYRYRPPEIEWRLFEGTPFQRGDREVYPSPKTVEDMFLEHFKEQRQASGLPPKPIGNK